MDIKELLNKRYTVRTVQMAMYNDHVMDLIGSPLSTENGIPTDKYDEGVIGVKITMKKIIEIYNNGLYLSITPKSKIIELAEDIHKVLDEFYANTSFNTRVQSSKIDLLDTDVKALKKFYSEIMSRNGKVIEYEYNKPKKSGFDLNIEDEVFDKKTIGKQVSHKEIIRDTLESSSSLMGSGLRYRQKGVRRNYDN